MSTGPLTRLFAGPLALLTCIAHSLKCSTMLTLLVCSAHSLAHSHARVKVFVHDMNTSISYCFNPLCSVITSTLKPYITHHSAYPSWKAPPTSILSLEEGLIGGHYFLEERGSGGEGGEGGEIPTVAQVVLIHIETKTTIAFDEFRRLA